MTGSELLTALAAADLQPCWTERGLRLFGDPRGFTPELKAAMREHRAWLEYQLRPLVDGEDIDGWNDERLFDAVATRQAVAEIEAHNDFVTALWRKKHGRSAAE